MVAVAVGGVEASRPSSIAYSDIAGRGKRTEGRNAMADCDSERIWVSKAFGALEVVYSRSFEKIISILPLYGSYDKSKL